MKVKHRWFAGLLAVIMIMTTLPATVFAADEEDESVSDDIIYNTLEADIMVSTDESKVENGDAFGFDEDGSFTIYLESDAFFPYEVQFQYNGETFTEWFMDPEDSVVVGGHTFYVYSEQTDPEAITQIGVWIDGEYVPAYPESKFTVEEGMADVPTTFSMMPLRERNFYIYLNGYFSDELKETTLDVITSVIEDEGYDLEGEVAVWMNRSVGEDYEIVGSDTTLDLSYPYGNYYPWYSYSRYIELIVGDTDQLNVDNIRYNVSFIVNNDSLLEASIATEEREEIIISSHGFGTTRNWYEDNSYSRKYYYQFDVYENDWPESGKVYLGFTFGSSYSNLSAVVYKGYYATEEDIPADAEDITSQIWDQDLSTSGGYLFDETVENAVTIVISRDGETVQVLPLNVRAGCEEMSIDYYYYIYEEDSNGNRSYVPVWRFPESDYVTYNLNAGSVAEATYYTALQMYHPLYGYGSSGYGLEYVEKAVVGSYNSVDDIPEDAEDIKAALFSYPGNQGGGYGADYSNGVDFTIVDIDGDIHHYKVTIVVDEPSEDEEPTLPSEPTPLSEDTYFRAQGAEKLSEGNIWNGYYNSYVMPYNADSYYFNGYQTVFLLNYDGTPVTEEEFSPYFYTGNKVTMYAGHNGVSGTKQVSGETVEEFVSGEPIHYSAAAEDGANLKNYWVTYLTQQEGPKLFVNAANDPNRYTTVTDPETGKEISEPEREIFIIEDFGNVHDVYFANIGDEDMKGMYVRLENPQNIMLDDYWTITEGSTLSAFTTVDTRDPDGHWTSYGELKNAGKVRLVAQTDADGNEIFGAVAGTLVIGYTGEGTEPIEEYRINLTGIAGNPEIVTSTIVDGVKYVPYSSVIQTNSMYESDAVTFSVVDGELPDGVILKPNGELYGLPTEVGEFVFTVKVEYTGSVYGGKSLFDTQTFTLTVLENTDENVDAVNTDSQGHVLLDRVTRDVWVEGDSYVWMLDKNNNQLYGTVYDSELFRSEGPYGDFIAFYLDGAELEEGTDYYSEEGSTRITIVAETFQDAGEGQHTIAAEFRTNGNADAEMKRTAQNVYVHKLEVIDNKNDGSSIRDLYEELLARKEALAEKNKDSVVESAVNAISITVGQGGAVTSNYTEAAEGTVVTITVTADPGYECSSIYISDEVELTDIGNNAYTFEMPGNAVDINVEFADLELPFEDVHEDQWFYNSVNYAYFHGMMNGTSDTMFSPDMKATRGMFLTVLYRIANQPEVSEDVAFTDIAAGSSYEKAVIWAYKNGIANSISDDIFGADEVLKREEMAYILVQFADYCGYDTTASVPLNNFKDEDQISEYALPALQWANAEGLVIGTSTTTLDPQGDTTRAQIATVLTRFDIMLNE